MDLHVIDVALACQLSAAQLPVWPFQDIAGTMCMTMLQLDKGYMSNGSRQGGCLVTHRGGLLCWYHAYFLAAN